jgi:hypothetical protein
MAPQQWMIFKFDMDLSGGARGVCHLTNVILFALNVGLLFLLVRRWTGRTGVALATALLWAFHPTRVESVAWVTARKDVLSGVFFFLGLWFYAIGWERRPRSASLPRRAPGRSVRPTAYRLAPTASFSFAWFCMRSAARPSRSSTSCRRDVARWSWPLGRTDWDRLWKDGWR